MDIAKTKQRMKKTMNQFIIRASMRMMKRV